MGIEPTRPAWKAGILPLNYTRIASLLQATLVIIAPLSQIVKSFLLFFGKFFYLASEPVLLSFDKLGDFVLIEYSQNTHSCKDQKYYQS